MGELDVWQSLGVALAVGLLIGAERERAKHGTGSPGVRTFALIALVGAVAALVPTVVAAAIVAGVVLLVAVTYVRSQSADPGTTSEMAAIATLGLGALSVSRPALAVGVAVAVTVLLVSRESLHHFVRETVTDRERTDALKFFVAAFIVLPLLPDGEVGPYGVWVPQRLWLLVVLITGIGWLGYAATRLLGARRGLMVTGLAGGFVSGTATTGVMGARVRRGEAPLRRGLAGAVLASVSTLAQLVVLTALVEPRLTRHLLPAALAGGAVLALEAWWLGRDDGAAQDDGDVPAGRPFALAPALVLAAIIAAVLPLAVWLEDRYGAAGSIVATAAGALADVHGASVAMATLVDDGQLGVATAAVAVGVGLATNTGSKLVVGAVAGGLRFAGALALLFVPVGAVIVVGLLLA
jgi:uncharacterized membrane protein (DUF4010 family)